MNNCSVNSVAMNSASQAGKNLSKKTNFLFSQIPSLLTRGIFLMALLCLFAPAVHAQISAEWQDQGDNLWVDIPANGVGNNWSSWPGNYPGLNENNDTAYFDGIDGGIYPNVTINASIILQNLQFLNTNGTESYNLDTVGNELWITNGELYNDSSTNQTLTNGYGAVVFDNSSIANNWFDLGGYTTINNGDGSGDGYLGFWNGANADVLGGTTINNDAGSVVFDDSSAGYATINNSEYGTINFDDGSTAYYSTINNIDNGTIEVSTGGTLGGSTINNTGNLTIDNTTSFDYYGSLSGTGNLAVTGGGTMNVMGGTGNTGNNATVTENTINVNGSTFTLQGDSGTTNGGSGGYAYLQASGLMTVDPSVVVLQGGNGTDNNAGDGGAGGVAEAAVSGLSVEGSTYEVFGGNGGNATGSTGNGGAGAGAGLISYDTVSVDSSVLIVAGGTGGDTYASGYSGGNGGLAVIESSGDIDLYANSSSGVALVVGGDGGNGQVAGSIGGSGGYALLGATGTGNFDSLEVLVEGGYAGFGYGDYGQTESSGGAATVALGALNLTSFGYGYSGETVGSTATLSVVGGAGGADDPYSYGSGYGNGGNGGDAVITVATDGWVESSDLTAAGGVGGFADSGNGGNGGNASVSFGGGLNVSSDFNQSDINITGGNGGDSNWDWYYAVGGNGGNASLAASSAWVDSSLVSIGGGNAGSGGGDYGSTEGAGGTASASFGDLTLVSDTLNMYSTGTNASVSLQGGLGGNDDGYGNGGNGGERS